MKLLEQYSPVVDDSLWVIDEIVGHWVKNIPYVFCSIIDPQQRLKKSEYGEAWKHCSRVYILSAVLRDTASNEGNFFFSKLPAKEECYHVSQYFDFTTRFPPEWIHSVFVNGVKVHLPTKSKTLRYFKSEDVYQFLGLDWRRDPELEITNTRTFLHDVLSPPRGSPFAGNLAQTYKINVNKTKALSILGKRRSDVCLITTAGKHMEKNALTMRAFTDQGRKHIVSRVYHSNYNDEWKYAANKCVRESKKTWSTVVVLVSETASQSGHAYLLLINNITKEVYLFDPWGEGEFEQEDIVYDVLTAVGLPMEVYKWRVREREDWCPTFGFQSLEAPMTAEDIKGYCSVWSLWMLDLLIKYPGRELSVLYSAAIRSISKNYNGDFLRFIRDYAGYLDKLPPAPEMKASYHKHSPLEKGTVEYPIVSGFYSDSMSLYKVPNLYESWYILLQRSEGALFSTQYLPEFDLIFSRSNIEAASGGRVVSDLSNAFGDKTSSITATFDMSKQQFVEDLPERQDIYADLIICMLLNDLRLAKKIFPKVKFIGKYDPKKFKTRFPT